MLEANQTVTPQLVEELATYFAERSDPDGADADQNAAALCGVLACVVDEVGKDLKDCIAVGGNPSFRLKCAAGWIPASRQISATATPSLPGFRMNALWLGEHVPMRV